MMHHVAQVISGESWALLQAQYGGREVSIPKTRNSGVWRDLCDCMGVAAADALVDYYGGDRLTVPMGASVSRLKRMQHIVKLRAQGMTPNQIAEVYKEERRFTTRTVKRILSGYEV
jgi:hypothetical protein